MLSLVIKEILDKLPSQYKDKYLKDIEEANLKPVEVIVASDYKNPLRDDYSSKGGRLEIRYTIASDKMPVIQTLQTINRINHYQSFVIDGVINYSDYLYHKGEMISNLAKLITAYYKKEKGKSDESE